MKKNIKSDLQHIDTLKDSDIDYSDISELDDSLFDSESAIIQLKRGIKDAVDGKLSNRGSFASFVDDNDK